MASTIITSNVVVTDKMIAEMEEDLLKRCVVEELLSQVKEEIRKKDLMLESYRDEQTMETKIRTKLMVLTMDEFDELVAHVEHCVRSGQPVKL